MGQNLTKNKLTAYREHNITLYKDFNISAMEFLAKVEVMNLANENYEVIKNFPMPGRSFRVTLKVTY